MPNQAAVRGAEENGGPGYDCSSATSYLLWGGGLGQSLLAGGARWSTTARIGPMPSLRTIPPQGWRPTPARGAWLVAGAVPGGVPPPRARPDVFAEAQLALPRECDITSWAKRVRGAAGRSAPDRAFHASVALTAGAAPRPPQRNAPDAERCRESRCRCARLAPEAAVAVRDLRHVWQATVTKRTEHGSGCPVCSLTRRAATQSRVNAERSLAVRRPDIATELHPTRNGDVDQRTVGASSDRKLWWLCSECGHGWQARIANRTRGTGCPACWQRRRTGR